MIPQIIYRIIKPLSKTGRGWGGAFLPVTGRAGGKAFLLLLTLLLTVSCRTHTSTIAVADTIRKDTIYIRNLQYDSIYVQQDRIIKDTFLLPPLSSPQDTSPQRALLIKEQSIQHRYRILHDTIRVTHHDSVTCPIIIPPQQTKSPLPVTGRAGGEASGSWVRLLRLLLPLLLIAYILHKAKRLLPGTLLPSL